MSRRSKQKSWIHENSRCLIGAIAILGAINTGYITLTKFINAPTVCPTRGCEQVLSSDYAYVFGIPLALFGLLAYVSMALFALAPLTINQETNAELRSKLEQWTWFFLFIGSTAMLVFSGYLMYIMATQFVALYGIASICIYCIVSATFATALFLITLLGQTWEDVGQLFFTGVLVSMVVLIGTLGIYSDINSPATASSADGGTGQTGPAIEATSGSSELALAAHLKQLGAKMYGAYWCPHCHDQKELFGRQAFEQIPYVECAPDGRNPQTTLCQEVAPKVQEQTGENFGFPTWEINGKFYLGVQSLNQLADLSGYQGSRDFQRQ